MNLLLLEAAELEGGDAAWLTGRRAHHLLQVLRVVPGQRVRAGVVDGEPGVAEILEAGSDRVRIRFHGQPGAAPDEGPSLELILALPRPKVLRRVLRAVAALAVRRLTLVNAWRVEKSYFDSPVLEAPALRQELLLGCEQGGHTRPPTIAVEPLLCPFLEHLPSDAGGELRLVADPGSRDGVEALRQPLSAARRVLAAVGPEGGWIERERESFGALGFRPLGLGPRILTTEVAVAVLIGQLQLLGRLDTRAAGL